MKASIDAARESVGVSRTIGEAQIRAYLSCESASYHVSEKSFSCTLIVRNHGQSPAVLTSAECFIVTYQEIENSAGATLQDYSVKSSALGPVIAAGACGEIFVIFLRGDLKDTTHASLLRPVPNFLVRGKLFWLDVFDRQSTQMVSLEPIREPQFAAREGDRHGEMKPYNRIN